MNNMMSPEMMKMVGTTEYSSLYVVSDKGAMLNAPGTTADFMQCMQAMEQMSRMTPQQMADMQRQMASLPPGFMQQQMAAMNSMDPAELQRRMRDADMHAPQGQTQGSLARSPHSTQEV